tara:strand:+ start:61 stop:189 length:129 start_codon:yes stop_codon:yes gene_type:complete
MLVELIKGRVWLYKPDPVIPVYCLYEETCDRRYDRYEKGGLK